MRKVISGLLAVLCLGLFLYSGAQLLKIFREYRTGAQLYESTSKQYVTPVQTEPARQESTPAPSEDAPEQEPDPVLDGCPITVDFDALQAENPDVVGWLYCPDTVISYPVVQGADNEQYLHRMLDGTENSAGTLFLDAGNCWDFSDGSSIVYGHNMKNNTMFGTLPKYRDPGYYDAHPVLWLLTPEETYRVELLAGLTVDTQWEGYAFFPEEDFLSRCMARSVFRPHTLPDAVEHLLILSTCSYEAKDARFVLLGALLPE